MAFETIYGHDTVKRRLLTTFENDRIPSAYLFLGADGIGKESLAREFAQLINCDTSSICHTCDNCRMFDNGAFHDYHLIKPSGQNIRISQIHQLIERLSLKPAYAKKRVVYVKHAERLNQESANSFLKILEEPPLDTLIVLSTTDEGQLLETILSRCQKIHFSPLSRDQLERIVTENYDLNEEELEFVLNYAHGRIRKGFINKVSELNVIRNQTLTMLLNLRTEKMCSFCDQVEKWGKKEGSLYFLEFCSAWVRDFICLLRGEGEKLINRDKLEELRRLEIRQTEERLHWWFDLIIETEMAIQSNAARQLALEGLLIQLRQVSHGTIVV